MVRLVLFDIDGTLIHSKGAGVKSFGHTFASEFKVSSGLNNIQFAGRTDTSIVREFFKLHSIPETPENFQRFFDTYVFWLDYLLRKTEGEICVGVWNFIHNLEARPNPPVIGLLTGNIRLGAEIKLRHYYLWENFEIGAFGDENEDRNKLAGIILDRARRKTCPGLQPEEVVVVGDTPLDIECAKAINARSLAVATGGASYDVLKQHNPTWLVHDLREAVLDDILK